MNDGLVDYARFAALLTWRVNNDRSIYRPSRISDNGVNDNPCHNLYTEIVGSWAPSSAAMRDNSFVDIWENEDDIDRPGTSGSQRPSTSSHRPSRPQLLHQTPGSLAVANRDRKRKSQVKQEHESAKKMTMPKKSGQPSELDQSGLMSANTKPTPWIKESNENEDSRGKEYKTLARRSGKTPMPKKLTPGCSASANKAKNVRVRYSDNEDDSSQDNRDARTNTAAARKQGKRQKPHETTNNPAEEDEHHMSEATDSDVHVEEIAGEELGPCMATEIRDDRKYGCVICGKVFLQSYRVKEHIKYLHMVDKPHQCTVCNKSFKLKSGVNRHMICHGTNEDKPHRCTICNASFKTKDGIKKHMVCHSAVTYTCDRCHNSYKRVGDLKCHQKSCTAFKSDEEIDDDDDNEEDDDNKES